MVAGDKIESLSMFKLLKSIGTVRHDWKLKNAYQKWCYLFSIGKAALQLDNIPLYEMDQTLNWYSYFGWVYIGTHVALVVYTVYYYITSGEFSKCLPCTAYLIGPVLSVSVEFVYSWKWSETKERKRNRADKNVKRERHNMTNIEILTN